MGVGLVWALFVRSDFDVNVSPIRNPTYVTMSDGSIRNSYDMRLRNKNGEDRPYRIHVEGDNTLRVSLEGTVYETVMVPANETMTQRVYVIAPRDAGPSQADRTDIRFWIEDLASGERTHHDTIFNGRDDQ